MPIKKAPKKAKKAARRRIASNNIREFHKGATFAKTRRKFGVATARRQAIAVGLRTAGLSKRKTRKRR